eukprot:gene11919-14077_t
MATATKLRGEALGRRCEELKKKLPATEGAFHNQEKPLRLTATSGTEWHATLCQAPGVDVSHFTENTMPAQLASARESCLELPPLQLMDPLSNNITPSILNYSNPDFVKTHWALQELGKATRKNQERRARRRMRKGTVRRGNPAGSVDESAPKKHVGKLARRRYTALDEEDTSIISMGAAATSPGEGMPPVFWRPPRGGAGAGP